MKNTIKDIDLKLLIECNEKLLSTIGKKLDSINGFLSNLEFICGRIERANNSTLNILKKHDDDDIDITVEGGE